MPTRTISGSRSKLTRSKAKVAAGFPRGALIQQNHLFAALEATTPAELEIWADADGLQSTPGHRLQATGVQALAGTVRNSGWGEARTHALSFGTKASMTVAAGKKLGRMGVFAVEMLVRPDDVQSANQRLIEAQMTPFSLALVRQGSGFRLKASAYVQHRPRDKDKLEWIGVYSAKPILPGRWSRVALVFTGDDLILLVNGRVAGRRVCRNASLGSIKHPKQTFWIGSWVDGARNRYRGRVGGVRVWSTIPTHFMAELIKAEDAGYGAISSRHEDWGGDKGPLGGVESTERSVDGGRTRSYQKGAIFWHRDHGAHPLLGRLWAVYSNARVRKGVGFPITDPIRRGATTAIHGERGAVYTTSKVAGSVWGPMYARYLTHTQTLGLPIGTPSGPKTEPERRCMFQRGMMYYRANLGAFEVHGPILARYHSLGGDTGFLGMPISDQLPVINEGKSLGQVARFERGAIYWSSKTGAFEVHGMILKKYEELGGPAGELGFPVANESKTPDESAVYSRFERGLIVWKGGTAQVVTKLELYLDNIKQFGAIDDGPGDSSGEFYTRVTVRVDGKTVINDERVPRKGESNAHVELKKVAEFPAHAKTKVFFKVDIWDWDSASGDDYHGRIEKNLSVHDLWGSGNGLGGVHTDNLTNIVRDNTPSFNRIRCTYTVRSPSVPVSSSNFRERGWWHFSNKGTPQLSRAQYVETFRDVDFLDGTFEAVLNAFDALYYEYAFMEAASGGNCFGFATEGLASLKGHSPFNSPLSKWSWSKTRHKLNVKQAYQYGAETINWAIENLTNLNMINPCRVFDHVEREVREQGACIVSLMNLDNGSGHAVLAYATQRGGSNNRHGSIFVADPNKPWGEAAGHPSVIEVFKNNRFKASSIVTRSNPQGFASNPVNFADLAELPSTLMFHVPYRIVSVQPRTPFWELLGALFILLGFLFVLAGDAETEQLSIDGKKLFKVKGGKRRVSVNEIPGLAMIPSLDTKRPQLMFASDRRLGGQLKLDLRGRRQGRFRTTTGLGLAGLAVDSPISANARDSIIVDAMGTPFPLASLETSQRAKTSKVEYGVAKDPTGRPARHFVIPLQQAKGDVARVAIEGRGGGLVISPAGPARTIDLEVSVKDGGQLRKGIIRGVNTGTGAEAIRVRAHDISNPLGNFAVERLSSMGGGVLEKKTIRGKSR